MGAAGGRDTTTARRGDHNDALTASRRGRARENHGPEVRVRNYNITEDG